MNEDVARLLGLYMAEGHISGNNVGFSFHRKEVEYHEFVQRTLTDYFKVRYGKPTIEGNTWQACVHSKALAQTLREVMGAGCFMKRVPFQIWRGSMPVKTAFLRGWFEGDACLPAAALTTSTAPADCHTLLNSIGLIASVHPYQASYKIVVARKREFDTIVFGGKLGLFTETHAFLRTRDRVNWTQAREPSMFWYTGDVHNLEIEEDQSYVVNGIVAHDYSGAA